MHTRTKGSLNALYFGVLSALWLAQPLFAQGSLKERITQAVDTARVSVIRGNMHPLARAEFDQGRVEPSMRMRVTMTFKMTAAQQADLDALLASQQERGSPDYHRWLTPEQYGGRFGLSEGDINKVTGWLESAGFHVEGVPASRNMITFSGTAQQAESALHTEIHRYVVEGQTHFANASEPSVPTALAGVVSGFSGLNNFQLKPRPLKASPRFTSSVSGNHFITPPDFATIYDVTPLYQKGFTGTGQTIAVVGQSDVELSDIRAFRSNSGLPANDPQPINKNNASLVGLVVPGDADPGLRPGDDLDEANLDVEWAGAIAYNATVIFIVGDPVSGGGVGDAIRYAITTSPIPAPVISTSFGECEADAMADGSFNFYQTLAQQANSEGITILGPSGDTGAADCDLNNPSSPTTASTLGLGVDVPGVLPTVTSVGGTGFTEGADTTHTYWKPAIGTDVLSSAIMYIPEGAWNDTDMTIPGTSTSTGLAAGGGGASSSIAKPAWQAGTGVPNDGARDVPDLSFSASPLHDPYLFCTETQSLSPTCVTGFRNGPAGNLAAVGGTSVGPPVMAGIVALINESTNQTGSGNINRVLYPLAARLPAAFHDVQSGNNQVPFSPPCVTSTLIGYSAVAGYDLATGLGSMDVFSVVSNWTAVTPASTANAASSADFSLSFAPAQLTVKRGACGNGTLVLTALNGFSGTPRFTCTAAGLGATTCAVVPAAISAGFDAPGDYPEVGWWGAAGVSLAGVALVLANFRPQVASDRESRGWARVVPGYVFVAVLATMAGCGGSSSKNTSDTSQVNYSFVVQAPSTAPAASGTVTVSAAIGGINHSAQMTVIAQ